VTDRSPPRRRIRLRAAVPLLLAAAVPAAADADEPEFVVPPGSGVIEEFLDCIPPEQIGGRVAPTAADMPWRVSIGEPRTSPKYGSRKQAREAAIEAMRGWERSIRTRIPWFALEFADDDPTAPVQVEWKRRTVGRAQGRGGPTCALDGEVYRAGGQMEIAVQACPTCRPLEVAEVGLLVAHEFGHVLGLGHCLDCDSAMNYSWSTIGRVVVTQTDVDAIVTRFGYEPDAEPDALTVERLEPKTPDDLDPL